MDEELTDHLGYERGDPAGRGSGNSRNGTTPKRVLTTVGPVDLDVPRDRNSTFEPVIVPKGATRLGVWLGDGGEGAKFWLHVLRRTWARWVARRPVQRNAGCRAVVGHAY